ncbi:MAG TPA: septum formation initiator family protein [bacterium]|jgi:cell division protein FtsB|nr:septum formation initiator family protein [bacterium]
MGFFRTIFTKQFFFTLLLIGLLVLLSFPLSKNWRQKRSIEREIAGLESQVKDMEGKNSNLKNVLDYMQSDQFVEEQARTKLNYKKPGESVVVIEGRPGETPETTTSPFSIPAEPEKVTASQATVNINKWLDYFFGVKK